MATEHLFRFPYARDGFSLGAAIGIRFQGPGPGARVKHQRKYFSTLQKSGGALPRGLTMGVEFGCIYARFVLAFGKVD